MLADKQLTFDELLLKQYTTQQSFAPQHESSFDKNAVQPTAETIKLMA